MDTRGHWGLDPGSNWGLDPGGLDTRGYRGLDPGGHWGLDSGGHRGLDRGGHRGSGFGEVSDRLVLLLGSGHEGSSRFVRRRDLHDSSGRVRSRLWDRLQLSLLRLLCLSEASVQGCGPERRSRDLR